MSLTKLQNLHLHAYILTICENHLIDDISIKIIWSIFTKYFSWKTVYI